jgi:GT2 family glycosyltransferase
MSSDIEVDVVIVCYNRKDIIRQTLDVLSRQTIKPNVILCDDGSTEVVEFLSYDIVKHFLYHRDDGKYHRVGRFNEGFKTSTSEFVVSMDDDCVPRTEKFIESHVTALQKHEVSCGRIFFPDNGSWSGGWFSTANLGLTRDAITKLDGGFDPKYDGFYGFEDHDLGNEVKKRGLSVRNATPGTEVNHIGDFYADGDRSEKILGHNRKIFVSKWGYDPTKQ